MHEEETTDTNIVFGSLNAAVQNENENKTETAARTQKFTCLFFITFFFFRIFF
jgi:hypothetical protein